MRKIYLLSTIVLFAVAIFLVFIFSSDKEKISNKQYREAFQRNYKIFTPDIPKSIDFASEPAPLDIFYVKEKLDREILINTYWHTSTILLIKRANRWFPVIEPILAKNEIPDDFKFLTLIESGLMNVVSPAGATGFWQFLEKTAKENGLEVNKRVDERYHVSKATEAACKYLTKAYKKFSNWTLVAAAYNAGGRRIKEAIQDQNTSDYYDLFLNDETSRYVYRILAIKTIYENPTKYGFYLREADLYPVIPTKEIKVTKSIDDLVGFAAENNINYKILKEFNPWLRSDKLPIRSGKSYAIQIPEKGYIQINKLKSNVEDFNAIFNDTLTVDQIE
ncbi:MAG: transglycosylase SLT domain-containing protein [Bacteroidales bacterium]|nr:transglycosylase SLT domain-containing protein [Bacteroidales bacterium]